jgi:hypothetical protein
MDFITVVVEAHFPDRIPVNIGVLVVDSASERLDTRFRTDLESLASLDDIEVIRGLPDLFSAMAAESGGTSVLRYLADSASNAIRVSEPMNVEARSAAEAVEAAFTLHVLGGRLR